MELWIRSQDKKVLMKVSTLEMLEDDNIYTTYLDKIVRIGKYETKERALEVLDEIQNLLKPIIKINYEYDDSQPIMNGEWLKSIKEESKIEELSTYVYEMPSE